MAKEKSARSADKITGNITGKNTDKSTQKNTHRAVELLETLRRLGGSARTSHLAETMGVSEETVRRTVKKLSKDGTVSRVHGGVYLTGDRSAPGFHQRLGERGAEKRRMAACVADLVSNGMSLFLDVGSSTAYAAEALRDKEDLLVVTNSLTVAQTLMHHHGNRVFIAGGELNRDGSGVFGASALAFIAGFHMDLAVLSADAIDADVGFLLSNPQEAEVAKAYVSHAKKRLVVADLSKTAKAASVLSCDPGDIDIFVTDRPPEADLAEALGTWQIETIIAADRKKKHDKD